MAACPETLSVSEWDVTRFLCGLAAVDLSLGQDVPGGSKLGLTAAVGEPMGCVLGYAILAVRDGSVHQGVRGPVLPALVAALVRVAREGLPNMADVGLVQGVAVSPASKNDAEILARFGLTAADEPTPVVPTEMGVKHFIVVSSLHARGSAEATPSRVELAQDVVGAHPWGHFVDFDDIDTIDHEVVLLQCHRVLDSGSDVDLLASGSLNYLRPAGHRHQPLFGGRPLKPWPVEELLLCHLWVGKLLSRLDQEEELSPADCVCVGVILATGQDLDLLGSLHSLEEFAPVSNLPVEGPLTRDDHALKHLVLLIEPIVFSEVGEVYDHVMGSTEEVHFHLEILEHLFFSTCRGTAGAVEACVSIALLRSLLQKNL